ncbi:MAG: hypothetical protein AAF541_09225 [Pseudomonadota bacterium]
MKRLAIRAILCLLLCIQNVYATIPTDVLAALQRLARDPISTSAQERALVYAHNAEINRAGLRGSISNEWYQAAQREFAHQNQVLAKGAAEHVGAEFTVQKRKPGPYQPGTDSDYITKVRHPDQITAMQAEYNNRVNRYLRRNGISTGQGRGDWHVQLDTDFMADPDEIGKGMTKAEADRLFRQVANRNNDAYKRRAAAEYERISRSNERPLKPSEYRAYAEEMKDFVAKKRKKIQEYLETAKKRPLTLEELDDLQVKIAQQQKYISRIEATDRTLRAQQGLPPRARPSEIPTYEMVADADGNMQLRRTWRSYDSPYGSVAERGAKRLPGSIYDRMAGYNVAENSLQRASIRLAESFAEAAGRNPQFASADDIAAIVDHLPPSDKGALIERLAQRDPKMARDVAQSMRAQFAAANPRATLSALEKMAAPLDNALNRGLSRLAGRAGLEMDSAAMAAARQRFSNAAGEVLGKLGQAVAVGVITAEVAVFLRDYITALNRLYNEPDLSAEEAAKLEAQARNAGIRLAAVGGIGLVMEGITTTFPQTVPVLVGAGSYIATRGLLENTQAGQWVDKNVENAIDAAFRTAEEATDYIIEITGGVSNRMLAEDEKIRLLLAYLKAIRKGDLKLQNGVSARDIMLAIEEGRLKDISRYLVEVASGECIAQQAHNEPCTDSPVDSNRIDSLLANAKQALALAERDLNEANVLVGELDQLLDQALIKVNGVEDIAFKIYPYLQKILERQNKAQNWPVELRADRGVGSPIEQQLQNLETSCANPASASSGALEQAEDLSQALLRRLRWRDSRVAQAQDFVRDEVLAWSQCDASLECRAIRGLDETDKISELLNAARDSLSVWKNLVSSAGARLVYAKDYVDEARLFANARSTSTQQIMPRIDAAAAEVEAAFEDLPKTDPVKIPGGVEGLFKEAVGQPSGPDGNPMGGLEPRIYTKDLDQALQALANAESKINEAANLLLNDSSISDALAEVTICIQALGGNLVDQASVILDAAQMDIDAANQARDRVNNLIVTNDAKTNQFIEALADADLIDSACTTAVNQAISDALAAKEQGNAAIEAQALRCDGLLREQRQTACSARSSVSASAAINLLEAAASTSHAALSRAAVTSVACAEQAAETRTNANAQAAQYDANIIVNDSAKQLKQNADRLKDLDLQITKLKERIRNGAQVMIARANNAQRLAINAQGLVSHANADPSGGISARANQLIDQCTSLVDEANNASQLAAATNQPVSPPPLTCDAQAYDVVDTFNYIAIDVLEVLTLRRLGEVDACHTELASWLMDARQRDNQNGSSSTDQQTSSSQPESDAETDSGGAWWEDEDQDSDGGSWWDEPGLPSGDQTALDEANRIAEERTGTNQGINPSNPNDTPPTNTPPQPLAGLVPPEPLEQPLDDLAPPTFDSCPPGLVYQGATPGNAAGCVTGTCAGEVDPNSGSCLDFTCPPDFIPRGDRCLPGVPPNRMDEFTEPDIASLGNPAARDIDDAKNDREDPNTTDKIDAQCNALVSSGGNQGLSAIMQLGGAYGATTIRYQTYDVPDSIVVLAGQPGNYGTVLWDSGGCVGTGTTLDAALNIPQGQSIKVFVTGACDDSGRSTAWNFTLACPANSN